MPLAEYTVARQVNLVHRLVLRLPLEHILSNVHQHRTGPAAGSNIKRFMDNLRQIGHILYQEIVFSSRASNSKRVCFLKGIAAHQESWWSY